MAHWLAGPAARRAFAFTNKAFPTSVLPLTATNPFKLRDERAFMTASVHALMFLYARLPWALCRLETTLPRLFLMSISRVKPDFVFSFEPLKTTNFASLPDAIFDTRFF